LKIKLTEKVEAVEVSSSKSSGESLTMGDLLKQAMEKK
jgi:ribosome-binding protein aMBF1 (putative translation factor)